MSCANGGLPVGEGMAMNGQVLDGAAGVDVPTRVLFHSCVGVSSMWQQATSVPA